MKKKLSISIILIILLYFIFYTNISYATLQVKSGVSAKTATIDYWIKNIRNMETAGETLGLNDSINSTDLTSSLDTSNNLDIHMQKNTEYGAMAILSASAYGNPSPIEAGDTTTGNKSGVYVFYNEELVSAGTISLSSTYVNAHGKYKNIYTSNINAYPHTGDAILETRGWHGATTSNWLSSAKTQGSTTYQMKLYTPEECSILLRSISDGLFSYDGYAWHNYAFSSYALEWRSRACYTKAHYSRPVIVCRSRNIKYKI